VSSHADESRIWNLTVHLKSKHDGLGKPVDFSKTREDQYESQKVWKPKRPIESTATNAEVLSQEDQYFTADSTEKLFYNL
jgi:hypothetical protein